MTDGMVFLPDKKMIQCFRGGNFDSLSWSAHKFFKKTSISVPV